MRELAMFQSDWIRISYIVHILLLLALATPAAAHHNTMTSKAGDSTPMLVLNDLGDAQKSGQLITQLSLELGRWDMPKHSTLVDLGQLDAYVLEIAQSWYFTPDLSMSMIVPIGIYQRDDGQQMTQSSGLGDLFLSMQQRWCNQANTANRLCISLIGGLTLPTGEYDTEQRTSVTQLADQGDGHLVMNTFNAQTSLGADTWATMIGVKGGWQPAASVQLTTEVGYLLPLSPTRDDITWGSDLYTRLNAIYNLSAWGGIMMSTQWQKHHYDRVPDPEQDEVWVKIGGRQTVRMITGLFVNLAQKTSCSVEFDYTPWSRLNTPQLIRTTGVQLGCQYSWGTAG